MPLREIATLVHAVACAGALIPPQRFRISCMRQCLPVMREPSFPTADTPPVEVVARQLAALRSYGRTRCATCDVFVACYV